MTVFSAVVTFVLVVVALVVGSTVLVLVAAMLSLVAPELGERPARSARPGLPGRLKGLWKSGEPGEAHAVWTTKTLQRAPAGERAHAWRRSR